MKSFKRLLKSGLAILLICIALPLNLSFGQTFEQALAEITSSSATDYAAPAVNSFAASINSGWFNKPPSPEKFGFNFEFGIIGMGSAINKNNKTFSSSGTFRLTEDQIITLFQDYNLDDDEMEAVVQAMMQKDLIVKLEGPTVVGSQHEKLLVTFLPDGDATIEVNHPTYPITIEAELPSENIELDVGGLLKHYPYLPSAAPQIKLGTVYGTHMVLRYFPKIKIDDEYGDFGFYGIGLQHNPAVWFKRKFKFDVAFGFLYQNMSVGNTVELKTSSYGMNFSRTFGGKNFNIIPYAGFMFESSEIKVDYSETIETDLGEEEVRINATMNGENKNRFTLGMYLHVKFVNFIFDYSFSKNSSFVAGMTFGF